MVACEEEEEEMGGLMNVIPAAWTSVTEGEEGEIIGGGGGVRWGENIVKVSQQLNLQKMPGRGSRQGFSCPLEGGGADREREKSQSLCQPLCKADTE